jgi:hypothetical protein
MRNPKVIASGLDTFGPSVVICVEVIGRQRLRRERVAFLLDNAGNLKGPNPVAFVAVVILSQGKLDPATESSRQRSFQLR